MKNLYILLWMLLSLSQVHGEDWRDRLSRCLLMADFATADSILKAEPQSVTLLFYHCSYENTRKDFYENLIDDAALEASADTLIRAAEDSLMYAQTAQARARYLFYTGSAYGFLAMHRGRSGHYASALAAGYKAVDKLQKALELDSTLVDAALGLGAYYYWTSARLTWLPFWTDRREEGLRLVSRSAEKGRYSRYMAIHQLVYMLLDAGQYEQAEHYALTGYHAFPESPYMLWALSHVYMKEKQLDKAVAIYRKLEKVLLALKEPNPHHLVVCRARLADMLARRGDCDLVRMRRRQIMENDWYKARRDDDEIERLLRETDARCAPAEAGPAPQ
ncbi:MAG: hypothetical protein D6677_11230 [Calditrichaeota bacterium]|nr:MAG: hypothetical protein D6677_11230 [Calditrichota bacterium]